MAMTLLNAIAVTSNPRSNSFTCIIPTENGSLDKLKFITVRGSTYLDLSHLYNIGSCLDLTLLDISFNRRLEGSVQSDFKSLVKLEKVFFPETEITGRIPNELCSSKESDAKHLDGNCIVTLDSCNISC
mmetsp:Transcript_29691/g.45000  ORF Transcript_29691/g.45000 Transcript_29691/m.45000 type:complete len:129 (+) Transcript_29691:1149-1535(+)